MKSGFTICCKILASFPTYQDHIMLWSAPPRWQCPQDQEGCNNEGGSPSTGGHTEERERERYPHTRPVYSRLTLRVCVNGWLCSPIDLTGMQTSRQLWSCVTRPWRDKPLPYTWWTWSLSKHSSYSALRTLVMYQHTDTIAMATALLMLVA